MPWRWKRQTQCAVAIVGLFAYALSPPWVELILARTHSPPVACNLLNSAYAPIVWCQARSEAVREFLQWESRLIRTAHNAIFTDDRALLPAINDESQEKSN